MACTTAWTGDEPGACKLFEDSLAKNPNAVGTILNVALCEAKAGKLAAAYGRFRDARDRAREQGLDEHTAASEKHMSDLAQQIGYLMIAFVEAPTASTNIEIDGRVSEYKPHSELLLDPGKHSLRITTSGRMPHATSIDVAAGQHAVVAIPALTTPRRSGRLAGKMLVGTGVALTGTGMVLALVALRRYQGAFDDGQCIAGSPPQCSAEGFSRSATAHRLGTVATVVGGVGVAATAVGLYFWLRPDHRSETRTAVVPALSDTSLGLAATGRF